MTHTVVWEGPARPEFNEAIQGDIDQLLERGLECASNLVFHNMWLDDDPEGRTVILFGKPEHRDTFFAEFIEHPEWATI